jgi:medium-chain acyl-[acyl-carrier-protein] hydrolase
VPGQPRLGESTRPTTVFCIPYAGGSGAVFRSWAKRLGHGTAVVPLELPGRGRRAGEELLVTMEAATNDLVTQILPSWRPPMVLFGYSLGALIAYRVALALRALSGNEPNHLVVAACRAPACAQIEVSLAAADDERLVRRVTRLFGQAIPKTISADPELLGLFLPVLRADLAVYESFEYVSATPLQCGVTALHGANDSLVRREHSARWQEVTQRPIAMRTVAGGHFFIHEPEGEQAIMSELANILNG